MFHLYMFTCMRITKLFRRVNTRKSITINLCSMLKSKKLSYKYAFMLSLK